MKKVITYGTYDLLHYGHIRLLERAKELGDYLVVGVTTDDFDKSRGKINVQQSLLERIAAIQATGLADEIIVEEYEGQKIDDIISHGIDIFAIGSDWDGKFDYLKDYCKVVYLERTQGVSSSEIRSKKNEIVLGVYGYGPEVDRVTKEVGFVNGLTNVKLHGLSNQELCQIDAIYICSHPSKHYADVKCALENHKHVLCQMPLTQSEKDARELFDLARRNNCVLMLGCKTAYSTAYNRMLLLAKGGVVGDIVSIDSICTSIRPIDYTNKQIMDNAWNSLNDWGPTALLPIFQLLGTVYKKKEIISRIINDKHKYDEFTKCTFIYSTACASIKVGKGVKSEGELIISGTKGYIYVPAPWWKTDYFEIRFENPENNKRYFYQLDGEGTRYELISFLRTIDANRPKLISDEVGIAVCKIMEDYCNDIDVIRLNIHKI